MSREPGIMDVVVWLAALNLRVVAFLIVMLLLALTFLDDGSNGPTTRS